MKKLMIVFGTFVVMFGLMITLQSIFNKKVENRIALFYPASHPSMYEIEQGVKETLAKSGTNTYYIDVYNANGNKTLLRAQAEEILQHEYLCIITIGAVCSQTIYTLKKKKNIHTPLVFCAIDDPIKAGLVDNLSSSRNQVTGCIVQERFSEQFDRLCTLKPATKRMLFVYDPAHGSGLEKVRNALENTARKKGIELKAVQIYQTNEVQQKVMPMLDGIDVIFVYTDHTVLAGIESLITLCNRYGITLYTSELNSADKGAALSFGVKQYVHGQTAAQIALQIIEEHKDPSAIPIKPVSDYVIKINTKTMQQQGLFLSEEDLDRVKTEGGIIL